MPRISSTSNRALSRVGLKRQRSLLVTGAIDLDFLSANGTGFSQRTTSGLIEPNGSIMIVGAFGSFNGSTTSNDIVRLLPTGARDSAVGTSIISEDGVIGAIDVIARRSNGNYILGGSFSGYNRNLGVARIVVTNSRGQLNLQASGSLQVSNDSQGSNEVNSIIVDADDNIYIGGRFNGLQTGSVSPGLVKINSNYTVDTSFNVGTGFFGTQSNPTAIVRSMALQPDGKLIVVGQFEQYNGNTANRIVRINTDGSIDSSFNIGTGFTGGTLVAVLQPNGKIIVGGGFLSYNETVRNRIIRLNADGSIDTTFDIGTGFNSTVSAIALQPNGKILVSGNFTTYNGVAVPKAVRLNNDGSIDTTFNIGTGPSGGTNGRIDYFIIQPPDNKVIVLGDFQQFNGTTVNGIVRLTGVLS